MQAYPLIVAIVLKKLLVLYPLRILRSGFVIAS